jgi:exopolysaccharide biosynthesis polyprenyl glycosylphosphotransferase
MSMKLSTTPVQNTAGTLGAHDGPYLTLKRCIDVALSALLLLVLSPFVALLAIGIKLHSPGPVFFRQTRIGKDGKPFTFLKFRSMRQDADPKSHQEYVRTLILNNTAPSASCGSLKMTDDPRITGLGRILRKFSLDELPQLLNVIRGEMSLVGPRPPLPYEVEWYEEWHKRRFEVLPGITGWWQVKGRNRVPFDEMVRMDIYYIEHMSLWLDLKILLLTPWEAFLGKGAG